MSPDVHDRVHSPYESQSEDRATPARVLVRRATAALRDEADALRLKLAEAVTRAAVAESDATEHAAHARAAREELRASAELSAVVEDLEEKARAFASESAALKKRSPSLRRDARRRMPPSPPPRRAPPRRRSR